MKILKDKNYYKVYLACVIIDGILSCFSIFLTVISIVHMAKTEFSFGLIFMVIVVLGFVILANILSWRSMLGYKKTPDVVLEVNENSITLTPDRSGSMITIDASEIEDVIMTHPIICRSGERIVIITKDKKYHLEDVENIKDSFMKLKEALNLK